MSPAVTRGVVIGTVVLLCLYNVAAVYLGGKESSISYVIAEAANYNPIIAVAGGILIGHWFWPV